MKESISTSSFYSNLSLLHFAGDTLIDITKSDDTSINEQYEIGEISPNHDPLSLSKIIFNMLHDENKKVLWQAKLKIAADELNWEKEKAKFFKIIYQLD